MSERKPYYALAVQDRRAEVTIFGDITSWPYLESDVSSYNLRHQLSGLDVDQLDVHINSYGGEVAEALAILNTLLHHPAQVTTYVDGVACSAASVIFMAGDRRVMAACSVLLVHPAWSSACGNAQELRAQADNLDTINDQSVSAYLARIGEGRSEEELRALMAEERFLGPAEAVEWGFATQVAESFSTQRPAQSARQLAYDKLTASPAAQQAPPPPAPQPRPYTQALICALKQMEGD